jgi:hypothetical protein
MHIKTPLFHYWEIYGGQPGDIYVGLNKQLVDARADLDGLIDLTYGNITQIKCIKAKDIQKCPIEQIPGYGTQVYIFKP